MHGFDEFFGNLYHLNAEEEPERPYWPKDDKEFIAAELAARRAALQGDRQGRCHRRAALGRVGKQTIEDTGPLTKKRMETIDDETTAAASSTSGDRPRRASRSSSG